MRFLETEVGASRRALEAADSAIRQNPRIRNNPSATSPSNVFFDPGYGTCSLADSGNLGLRAVFLNQVAHLSDCPIDALPHRSCSRVADSVTTDISHR